ncbi:MAG: rhombosortase [Gammaproteobacteria bacterium]|nr:rhombosortase [Gammaproteobacteria bacterium]
MKEFIFQSHPWLLLSLLVLIMLFTGEEGASVLQYQRLAITDGEFYRLLTGHLVHTNLYHSFVNLAGLVLIGVLSRYHMTARDWWFGLFISFVAVSAGLLLFDPQVQWYRGLSGVLHGIMVLLILKARQLAGFLRLIILAGLLVKIILEQLQIGFWQSDELIGAPVIVNAHLYGIVGGLMSYLVLHLTRSKRMFRENF